MWTLERLINLRYNCIFIHWVNWFTIRKRLFCAGITTARKNRLKMILNFVILFYYGFSFNVVMASVTFSSIFYCCETISEIVIWRVFLLRFLINTWVLWGARWRVTWWLIPANWSCPKTALMFLKCNLTHNYNRM